MAENYCIFTSNFFPNAGKVTRYTYSLAKKLQSEGKNVFIVTNNVFGLSAFENIDGIKIYRLPCYNFVKGYFPIICNNKEAKGILAILRKIKFKVVIINNTFHIHSLIGAVLGKQVKAKVICIQHSSAYVKWKKSILNIFLPLYEHIITFFVKHYTNEFYGVCKASSRWLKRFGIKSEGELYNSVNAEYIEKTLTEQTVNFKERLNIDVPIITYAGRLIEEKGLEKLISAFKEVRKTNPSALVITGDGELRETLEETKEEGVYFLGQLKYNELMTLLGESKIFCLPIDYPEINSSGVFEAASAGAFIITTKNGGAEELIDSDKKGIILKENTAENIAAALNKVLSDEKYRKSATTACKRAIKTKFSLQKTAKKIIAIAEETVEEEELI